MRIPHDTFLLFFSKREIIRLIEETFDLPLLTTIKLLRPTDDFFILTFFLREFFPDGPRAS